MTNNIVPIRPRHIQKIQDPVVEVCNKAGEVLKNVLILGEDHEGQVQLLTTVPDLSEVLWYMEAARFAIMNEGVDDA